MDPFDSELLSLYDMLTHKVNGTSPLTTSPSSSSLNKQIRESIMRLRELPKYLTTGPNFKATIAELEQKVSRWGHFRGREGRWNDGVVSWWGVLELRVIWG